MKSKLSPEWGTTGLIEVTPNASRAAEWDKGLRYKAKKGWPAVGDKKFVIPANPKYFVASFLIDE